MNATRKVHDALGEIVIDADVLWGAQTQRAIANFQIGGERMPAELIRALLLLKGIGAAVNGRLGRLPQPMAQAIDAAATELLAAGDAAVEAHFPLSTWQSGSGTQSHMNVNEVLARLAGLRLAVAGRPGNVDASGPAHAGGSGDGSDDGSDDGGNGSTAAVAVHPNDHVNLGQSSNDMVPSAMHVAAVIALRTRLQPALATLAAALQAQAAMHADLIKLGRTHLQDAVPMTVGSEIGAWRSQLLLAGTAIEATMPALHALAVGGTAVGTGLNTHPDFAAEVCRELGLRTGSTFVPAPDRYAALAGHEPLVALHGALKTLAVALTKIANDLRLLASGPRSGFGEWVLPANEPGSSIMPGKVNPTQCESVVMVCCQVVGNDMAVTMGAAAGHLQLNTCKPLIAANVLRSVRLLADAMVSFEAHTVRGMAPDAARIGALMAGSLMLVTALAPHIGYERAARIAHRAHADHTTLREAAIAEGIAAADFDRWADPRSMLASR